MNIKPVYEKFYEMTIQDIDLVWKVIEQNWIAAHSHLIEGHPLDCVRNYTIKFQSTKEYTKFLKLYKKALRG